MRTHVIGRKRTDCVLNMQYGVGMQILFRDLHVRVINFC